MMGKGDTHFVWPYDDPEYRKGNKGLVCPRCGGKGRVPDDRVMGAKKRTERIEAGLTLREMAYRMSVSPAYLSDLELGRRRWGSKQLERFANALP